MAPAAGTYFIVPASDDTLATTFNGDWITIIVNDKKQAGEDNTTQKWKVAPKDAGFSFESAVKSPSGNKYAILDPDGKTKVISNEPAYEWIVQEVEPGVYSIYAPDGRVWTAPPDRQIIVADDTGHLHQKWRFIAA